MYRNRFQVRPAAEISAGYVATDFATPKPLLIPAEKMVPVENSKPVTVAEPSKSGAVAKHWFNNDDWYPLDKRVPTKKGAVTEPVKPVIIAELAKPSPVAEPVQRVVFVETAKPGALPFVLPAYYYSPYPYGFRYNYPVDQGSYIINFQ